jgi:hypothetical protein
VKCTERTGSQVGGLNNRGDFVQLSGPGSSPPAPACPPSKHEQDRLSEHRDRKWMSTVPGVIVTSRQPVFATYFLYDFDNVLCPAQVPSPANGFNKGSTHMGPL